MRRRPLWAGEQDVSDIEGPEGASLIDPAPRSAMHRLRNYFLTGLVVVVPLFLTVYLTWAFIVWIDSWVTPLIPAAYSPDKWLPISIPGFGVLVALFVITMLGFLTANLVGRTFVAWGESILARTPLIRNLYRGLKQIVETVISNRTRSFKTVALVEYPRPGLWSLAFVVTEAKGEIRQKLGKGLDEDFYTCFIPATPTSVTGYIVFARKTEVILLDMTPEDAAKMVISAGLVSPEYEPVIVRPGEPVTIEEVKRRVRQAEQFSRRV
jgi:uncharacterized membrane protein